MLDVFKFPDDDDILCCMISAGHFCTLNTALHPVDHTEDCNFYLFKNNKVAMGKFQKILIVHQTIDSAIKPNKLYVPCLTH